MVAVDGEAAGLTGVSETLIRDSATGAANGRAGPVKGTSSGTVVCAVRADSVCVDATVSGTAIFDSARGAASGRFGPEKPTVVSPGVTGKAGRAMGVVASGILNRLSTTGAASAFEGPDKAGSSRAMAGAEGCAAAGVVT